MKNLKEIKTTLIGCIFLLASFDYELTKFVIEVDDPRELYFVGGLVIGLALLLAPDSIITGLGNIVKKKTE